MLFLHKSDRFKSFDLLGYWNVGPPIKGVNGGEKTYRGSSLGENSSVMRTRGAGTRWGVVLKPGGAGETAGSFLILPATTFRRPAWLKQQRFILSDQKIRDQGVIWARFF